MNKRYFIFLLTFLLLVSCSSTETSDSTDVTLPNSNDAELTEGVSPDIAPQAEGVEINTNTELEGSSLSGEDTSPDIAPGIEDLSSEPIDEGEVPAVEEEKEEKELNEDQDSN